MTGAILLDTDVLVDFLRGYSKAVAFVNTNADRIILSAIVVAELYAGVKGDVEQTALEDFVSLFRVVPVDAEIAKIGGLCKRDYGKSHGVGLADGISSGNRRGLECGTEDPQHQTLSHVEGPKAGLREIEAQCGLTHSAQ